MDKRTYEALLGSITKWESIVAGFLKNKGAHNCPLCKMFNDSFSNECAGCPVKDKTGAPYCIDSPYKEYEEREDYFISTFDIVFLDLNDKRLTDEQKKELRSLAQAELDFLRSLLPTEEPKA